MPKEIRKLLKLPKQVYYETHLNLLNCILPVKMTPREVEILAAFMSLEGNIAQYRFGPSAKKIIRQDLQLSPAGLSNFIGSLMKKGFLIQQGDMINILPLLVPEATEQTYIFKLINEN